uniref:Uncharacterized protein n=1 Tax=Chenopodium quinoa TaxID=63459 RepID=A0A803M9J1_CHEQI
MFFTLTISYDRKSPPKSVHEVCHRSGPQLYWYCIDVFNTGAAVEGTDMKFLSYFARDFSEDNATNTLDRINNTLIPNQPDPYIQEVLCVCREAFSRLKDELENRVNTMIVVNNSFEEAKVWVEYGMGLMDSCRAACYAKPHIACPLDKNLRDTHGVLKLLAIVLQLLTEGVLGNAATTSGHSTDGIQMLDLNGVISYFTTPPTGLQGGLTGPDTLLASYPSQELCYGALVCLLPTETSTPGNSSHTNS